MFTRFLLVPAEPRQFSVTVRGGGSILSARWLSPLHTNGPLLGYEITAIVVNSTHTGDCSELPGTYGHRYVASVTSSALSHDFTNLEPNSRYVVWVRANTTAGYGLRSQFVCRTTACESMCTELTQRLLYYLLS